MQCSLTEKLRGLSTFCTYIALERIMKWIEPLETEGRSVKRVISLKGLPKQDPKVYRCRVTRQSKCFLIYRFKWVPTPIETKKEVVKQLARTKPSF